MCRCQGLGILPHAAGLKELKEGGRKPTVGLLGRRDLPTLRTAGGTVQKGAVPLAADNIFLKQMHTGTLERTARGTRHIQIGTKGERQAIPVEMGDGTVRRVTADGLLGHRGM